METWVSLPRSKELFTGPWARWTHSIPPSYFSQIHFILCCSKSHMSSSAWAILSKQVTRRAVAGPTVSSQTGKSELAATPGTWNALPTTSNIALKIFVLSNLDFDRKWPPTAVQSLLSHEDGHRFPYKCIPGSELSSHRCIDARYETVSWRIAEHCCMYSITQKLFSVGDAIYENGGA
jgi:hypothetical protein